MAKRALRYALEVHPDAEITVMHVVGVPSGMMGESALIALAEDIEEAAREHAETVLDSAKEIAAEYDTEISTEVGKGNPSRAILDRAGDFDVVVLGTHSGTLAERLIVGNVAKRIFRRSPVPVTVVR